MNLVIRDAIVNKRVLEFSYNGHHRIVEPHAYGMDHKFKEVLRCFQTGGTTDSGMILCWKLFDADKIETLTATSRHFLNARPGYRKGDRSMSTIFCEL